VIFEPAHARNELRLTTIRSRVVVRRSSLRAWAGSNITSGTDDREATFPHVMFEPAHARNELRLTTTRLRIAIDFLQADNFGAQLREAGCERFVAALEGFADIPKIEGQDSKHHKSPRKMPAKMTSAPLPPAGWCVR